MPRLRSALTLSEVEVSTVLLGKQKPTQTPWQSPARKIFSGDIENLSCLVEQGISNSNVERIPRHSVA
jgi:hypothetical protein